MKAPDELIQFIDVSRAAGQTDSFEYKRAVISRFLWEEWSSFDCERIYNKRIRLRDDDQVGISALYEEFKDIIEVKDVSLAEKLAAAKAQSEQSNIKADEKDERELL